MANPYMTEPATLPDTHLECVSCGNVFELDEVSELQSDLEACSERCAQLELTRIRRMERERIVALREIVNMAANEPTDNSAGSFHVWNTLGMILGTARGVVI